MLSRYSWPVSSIARASPGSVQRSSRSPVAMALLPRYQLWAERAECAMPTPGLIVAPLTPFTSDLKVDEAGLARQIDYVVKDCRATMVVAAGVGTQEYTYLSLAEQIGRASRRE